MKKVLTNPALICQGLCPLSLLIKVFENLAISRLNDHLKKCGLSGDSEYGFRSSWSIAEFLTVASDIIARAFDRSGATLAIALDASKAFNRL